MVSSFLDPQQATWNYIVFAHDGRGRHIQGSFPVNHASMDVLSLLKRKVLFCRKKLPNYVDLISYRNKLFTQISKQLYSASFLMWTNFGYLMKPLLFKRSGDSCFTPKLTASFPEKRWAQKFLESSICSQCRKWCTSMCPIAVEVAGSPHWSTSHNILRYKIADSWSLLYEFVFFVKTKDIHYLKKIGFIWWSNF